MTRAMLDGMDDFWRMRALARHLGAAARSAAPACCRSSSSGRAARRRALGRARVPRLQPDGARCATPRSPPAAPFDSCSRRRRRSPAYRRRAGRRRPTTRRGRSSTSRFTVAVQHERAAGGEHQLRLHRRRLADRPADRRPSLRRPRRAAGGARLGADAASAAALAGAAGAAVVSDGKDRAGTVRDPRSAHGDRAASAMTRIDLRGNPVSTDSAAALGASRASAVANDVVLRHADRRPRRGDRRRLRRGRCRPDEGGLPAQPHRGRRCGRRRRCLLDEAAALAVHGVERERDHHAALRTLAVGRLGRRMRALGSAAAPAPARRARTAVAAPVRLLPRRRAATCSATSRRVLPEWPDDDALQPYVLALHAFGLEESARYAEAEATGRRALAGAARVPWAIHAVAHVMEMQGRHEEGARWMGEWRRDWGAREGDGSGGEPTASSATWAGTRRCSRSRPRHATALRVFDDYLDAEPDRDHAAAVDAAALLWRLRLLGADVGDALAAARRLPGRSMRRRPGARLQRSHAMLALIGAGSDGAGTRRGSRSAATRGHAPAGTPRSRARSARR